MVSCLDAQSAVKEENKYHLYSWLLLFFISQVRNIKEKTDGNCLTKAAIRSSVVLKNSLPTLFWLHSICQLQ